MSEIKPFSLFQSIRFVLVEPSHPGNIGATARAMKTMGLQHLVLVKPRYPVDHPDAIALASGADDLLMAAQVVDDLSQALHNVNVAVALSARSRALGPPSLPIRHAVEHVFSLPEHSQFAFVFGCERTGLSNEQVQRCQIAAAIPTSATYQSLNLAQAVQIVAYEIQQTLEQHQAVSSETASLAQHDDLEKMFAHLEHALIALGFLNPHQPKKLMPRLRQLFARTALTLEEVNIFRGIAKSILRNQSNHER